jgi:sugar/nucleoside kinase (ribokinase family)
MHPTFSLTIDPLDLRYSALIGTGGIGSGMFFALDGNHTLGREESRSGHFLDRRDYCKLHIVSHYVCRLLGPGFPVIPLGMVGADEAGDRLRGEMAEVGLDLRYVGRAQDRRTLYALCLIYPDGSGGNVTENDSACAAVDAGWIDRAEAEFARFAGAGIALALPEVPLDARQKLLALGTTHGFLRVASFTTAEILELAGELGDIDLLALNLDEAAALAGVPVEGGDPEVIVRAALAKLGPAAWLTVTAGSRGSWSWDGAALTQLPILPVRVEGTAGAGDAHLAGIVAGLAAGLSLRDAHQLGVLTAAVAVQSPHTINFELDRDALRACAETTGMPLAGDVRALLLSDSINPPDSL